MTRRWFPVLLLVLLLLPAPARADRLQSELRQIAPFAEQGMREFHVPGLAVAVVHGGRTVWAKGFGVRRAGTDLPVTPDTVFQVGSTTKALTVAIMAALADAGKVGWDDRVTDHFPGFALYDPWVTREFRIHDLFAHRSGLPPYAGDLQFFIGYGRDHAIRSLRHIQPVSSFRDAFAYQNSLFIVAGKVEEMITGKPWETLVRERILGPLGMTGSSLTEAGLTNAPDHAAPHQMDHGKPTPIDPGHLLYAWPYVYGPAGGLNSSVRDMAKWLAVMLGRGASGSTRLFSETAWNDLLRPRTPMEEGSFHADYCQGWIRTELPGTDIYWHNGSTSGACSFVGFSPDLDTGIVVLTNLTDQPLADAIGFRFLDRLSGVTNTDWLAELQGDDDADNATAAPEPAKLPQLPGLPVQRYAGDYDNPVLGPLSVRVDGDGLTVRFGKDGRCRVQTRHDTLHAFVGDWPDMDPDYPEVHFDFQVDGDGTVYGVLLREYDDDGCGYFDRRADN